MRPQPMHVDGLPPLAVPFRFFLTAPMFGIAAAVLLLIEPDGWMSRWTGAAFAAVHLLALGFVSMVTVGALFQVIPVLGGRAIARATTVAPWIHASLSLGTALLAASLLRPELGLWPAVLALFGLGFGIFLVAAGHSLLRRGAAGDSIFVMRLAMVALLVTVLLGLFLASCRAWPDLYPDYHRLTYVHLAWGLAGWIGLLVMGVSLQVIPMFQVAPAFGPRLARATALVLFLALVALGFARDGWPLVVVMTGISGALVTYAVHALSVLARRRRRRVDALNAFWRLSLGSLIAAAALGWAMVCTPLHASEHAPRFELLLGVLALLGFVMSVMLGMLMKIASFLAFLHLQRRCLADVSVAHLLPTMDAFVGDTAGRSMLGLHAVTLATALAAALWPEAGRAAAGLLATDFSCLLWILCVAALRYRAASVRIGAALGGQGGLHETPCRTRQDNPTV